MTANGRPKKNDAWLHYSGDTKSERVQIRVVKVWAPDGRLGLLVAWSNSPGGEV